MADIRNYLPARLRKVNQKVNQAFIKAINEQNEKLLELIQACIDQFFLTTATGRYLVQLGEQEGFVMPPNSGLDISAYRVLVPLMVSSPKQIRRTFEEAIEAFYTSDKTRPSITASFYAPYNLISGDDLHIETEKGITKISILSANVSDITNISASELSAIINSTQSNIFADNVEDRLTGRNYLRLKSTTVGTTSFIRIVGGTAQNILKFPNTILTEQEVGTQWVFSKPQAYSDVMTITWTAGTNPKLYLIQKGDVLTIRNLPDYLTGPYGSDVSLKGSEDNSSAIIALHTTNEQMDMYVASDTGHGWLWNGSIFVDVGALQSLAAGSYEIIESGYDYVVVRNSIFPITSFMLNQPEDNTLFFTSQKRISIYNNKEYGLASEVEAGVATITVPAIPPLSKRFLTGSSHLHGLQLPVLSFTRNSLTVECSQEKDKPVGLNQFVLSNIRMMYNFRKAYYKTVYVDSSVNPIYAVQSNDDEYSILPFTFPVLIGEDSIHCEVNSDELIIGFTYPHGLLEGWGFTLSDVNTIGNLTSSMINKEFITNKVISPYYIVCSMRENSGINIGLPIYFSGVAFGTFNIYRYLSVLDDGSDFYLEFPDEIAVIASGLKIGTTFVIQPDSGTDVDLFYADAIKHRKLQVKSIIDNKVNIITGLGSGTTGAVILNASGNRSADFGGTNSKYYFDQNSNWNINNAMKNLTVCFLDYTKPKNASYVSSYLYDPTGSQTLHTLSKYITYSSEIILRGSNPGVMFVDKISNLDGGFTFPSSGTMMLDYGTDDKEGPISYLAVIDGGNSFVSQIIIDPAYRFKKTHQSGAQIQYIHSNAPYVPSIDGSAYPVYVTGTAQARNTLFKLLEGLVAGGIFLQPDILFPDIRYSDESIAPFE